MPPHATPSRSVAPTRAFTLIELLTVIAIVGILAAILIPTVGRVRDTARASRCASNLRQISQAVLLFVDENRGRFPDGPGWDAKTVAYLNLGALYSQPPGTRAPADIFTCPADTQPRTPAGGFAPNQRSYVANGMDASKPGLGVFSRLNATQAADPNTDPKRFSRKLSDMPAPSRTILLAEKYTDNAGNPFNNVQFYGNGDVTVGWLGPSAAPKKLGSTTQFYHGAKHNYSFADGHVEALTPQQVAINNQPFANNGRWQAMAN